MTDILDTIDATVDGRCACGCRRRLHPRGASGWFATEACQRRYQGRSPTLWTDPTAMWTMFDRKLDRTSPGWTTRWIRQRPSGASLAYTILDETSHWATIPELRAQLDLPPIPHATVQPVDGQLDAATRAVEAYRGRRFTAPASGLYEFTYSHPLGTQIAFAPADRCEAGPNVLTALSDRGPFGLRLIVSEDIPADAWRIVATDGTVLDEGRIR